MRLWQGRKIRRLLPFWATGTLVAAAALGFLWIRSPRFGLPFNDSFSSGRISGWTPYAGNWTVVGNAVRNDSDERGAKLITGSTQWTSYAIDADLQMLGAGDAGVLARVGNVEEGVDSYDGYYAGLRTNDGSLILGRAQHGWYEFPDVHMPGGVTPGKWYHLRFTVQNCVFNVSATELGTHNTASIQTSDPNCFSAGKAGLRSMGAGGLWRNIYIDRLPGESTTQQTVAPVSHLAVYPTSQGVVPPTIAEQPALDIENRPAARPIQSIRSLRLLSTSKPAHVVVRGAIVLVDSALYIQDSTGGARVEKPPKALLRVGDEVEVEGDVYPSGLSATIRNANVEVVGGLVPIPPLSVTADQAASGAYDSMFIEVEGRLVDKASSTNHGSLEFRDGAQDFRALTDSDITRSAFEGLQAESTVRLRGVCMLDPGHTQNTVPFVLIVDSPEKVKILMGPPWWSPGHLVALAIAMLGIGFLVHLFFSRAEEWRLRAVIRERERLAHEIHDTLSQSFAGIGFQLRAIRNRIMRSESQINPQSLLEELNVTCELVRHSHDEARRSITSLRPETLETNGLVYALEQSARRAVGRGSVIVHSSCSGEPQSLPLGVLDALFRIGQEAIANAIHHGQPKSIAIQMEYERSSVALAVQDDGTGFIHKPESSGFGLVGMRRRAEAIGASLEIQSIPNSGCRIFVRAPIPHTSLLGRLSYSKQ